MSSMTIWYGIARTLLTLGMTMLIIGIILVTIPGKVFTIGVFFLVAGVIGVIVYLLFTIVMCITKRASTPAETQESVVPQGRRVREDTQQSNSAAYAAPSYEEVVDPRYMHPPTDIWTVGLRPGQSPLTAELGEPPPYSVVDMEPAITSAGIAETDFADGRGPAPVNPPPDNGGDPGANSGHTSRLRIMMPHQLRRISSDIHEILATKDISMHLEPLTPPPAYLENPEPPLTETHVQPDE